MRLQQPHIEVAMTIEHFTESFKWPGTKRSICFTGESYDEWVNQVLPFCDDIPPTDISQAKKNGIRVGDYIFYKRILPNAVKGNFFGQPLVKSQLQLYRRTNVAYCYFDKNVGVPILANSLMQPWMSLTPNEVLTQRSHIKRMCGNVGLAGLGLGWAARKILLRDKVTSLTIFEVNQSIIEFFGKPLTEQFGDKVSLVQANAYDVDWAKFDASYWDIWMCWGEASHDYSFWQIKKRLMAKGRICEGWGQAVHNNHYR